MAIGCVSSNLRSVSSISSHFPSDKIKATSRRYWTELVSPRKDLLKQHQFSAGSSQKSEATIIKLIPPLLTPKTILKKVVCTRPMRQGRFQISKELIGSQEVVHCYGHGGARATTLPGSVAQSIKEFEKGNPSKSTPIRILGSGFMGLMNAIELSHKGYKVAGITTKELYDIPSFGAAGYFALVSIKTSADEAASLSEINRTSFLTYKQISQGLHPYISSEAARYMPVFCSKSTESGVEDLEALGLIPKREQVTLDFGNGVIHPEFVRFMTYFINTTQVMHSLQAEVERLGIPIDIKKINSFSEVKEKIVFNCTGLGARELNNDANMIDVRGHLILLTPEAGKDHMDYMIYTKVIQDGQEEYVYLFPKDLVVTAKSPTGVVCKGVCGGTFIPKTDLLSTKDRNKLDQREFKKLLDRFSLFFQGRHF